MRRLAVISALDKMSGTDTFTNLKWLYSFVTFNLDEYTKKRADIFKSLFEALQKSIKFNKEKETSDYIVYASEVLLGTFQFEMCVPKDPDKVDFYFFHTERIKKFSGRGGTIELELSKKEAEEILSISTELLTDAKELGSIITRFNNGYSTIVGNLGSQTDAIIKGNLVGGALAVAKNLFSKSGRMMNKISMVMLDSTGAVYNLSFGNVKQAASIVEKFVK